MAPSCHVGVAQAKRLAADALNGRVGWEDGRQRPRGSFWILAALVSDMTALALALGLTITLHKVDVFGPPKRPDAALWEHAGAGDGAPVPVSFKSGDGVVQRGWRFAARLEQRPYLLFFYGSNEDVRTERRRLAFLADALDINTVAFDYRGYGFSDGNVDPQAIRSDALLAYDAVRSSAGSAPILIYGWSVGAEMAVHVAAARPAAGLILQAPPASADAMAAASRKNDVPRLVRWAVSLRFDDETRAVFQGAHEIRGASQPLLVLQGDRDEVVPLAQARQVFTASAAPYKTFVTVPGAHHNDLRISTPPALPALISFVQKASP